MRCENVIDLLELEVYLDSDIPELLAAMFEKYSIPPVKDDEVIEEMERRVRKSGVGREIKPEKVAIDLAIERANIHLSIISPLSRSFLRGDEYGSLRYIDKNTLCTIKSDEDLILLIDKSYMNDSQALKDGMELVESMVQALRSGNDDLFETRYLSITNGYDLVTRVDGGYLPYSPLFRKVKRLFSFAEKGEISIDELKKFIGFYFIDELKKYNASALFFNRMSDTMELLLRERFGNQGWYKGDMLGVCAYFDYIARKNGPYFVKDLIENTAENILLSTEKWAETVGLQRSTLDLANIVASDDIRGTRVFYPLQTLVREGVYDCGDTTIWKEAGIRMLHDDLENLRNTTTELIRTLVTEVGEKTYLETIGDSLKLVDHVKTSMCNRSERIVR